jgi:ABC-type uncharacterized transport system permease subunit
VKEKMMEKQVLSWRFIAVAIIMILVSFVIVVAWYLRNTNISFNDWFAAACPYLAIAIGVVVVGFLVYLDRR